MKFLKNRIIHTFFTLLPLIFFANCSQSEDTPDNRGVELSSAELEIISPYYFQEKLNVIDFGATNDGSTDSSSAIDLAIIEAEKRNLPLYFPKGQYNYSRVIKINSAKIFGDGDSSILFALDPQNESIFLSGETSEVGFLKLAGNKSDTRLAAWEATRITIFGAKNFHIDHVTIESSAAAGIQTAQKSEHGKITNCKIRDTLADAIHITDKSAFIEITNNNIENAGDDGIAVVSYQGDLDYVHDIVAKNNKIKNNKWGRLMSVVGGKNILYRNNHLDTNLSGRACIYLGQESFYNTFTIENVEIDHNTLLNCGGSEVFHGAIMIVNESNDKNSNVRISNNDIVVNNQIGIRILTTNNNLFNIFNNKITGTTLDYDLQDPGVQITPYLSGEIGYNPLTQ